MQSSEAHRKFGGKATKRPGGFQGRWLTTHTSEGSQLPATPGGYGALVSISKETPSGLEKGLSTLARATRPGNLNSLPRT